MSARTWSMWIGVLIVLRVGTMASAQQLPVPAPVTGAAAPVSRDTPPDTETATTKWVGTTEGAITAGLALVAAIGPSVHVTTPTTVMLVTTMPALSGTYTVRATFRQGPGSTGAYGVTLGGDGTPATAHMVFLVAPDRRTSVWLHDATSSAVQDWTVLPSGTEPRNGTDRLEVRVTATDARFIVNGVTIARVPLSAGQLDGTPAVHVGVSGDVLVTALTVERAAPWVLR